MVFASCNHLQETHNLPDCELFFSFLKDFWTPKWIGVKNHLSLPLKFIRIIVLLNNKWRYISYNYGIEFTRFFYGLSELINVSS